MINKFVKYLRINSTNPEAVLWYYLRNRRFKNYKFRRQVPLNKFIVDFVCMEKMLIIELDGGQHTENITYDANRSKILNNMDYNVIRFWNNDVLNNLAEVLNCIEKHLNTND